MPLTSKPCISKKHSRQNGCQILHERSHDHCYILKSSFMQVISTFLLIFNCTTQLLSTGIKMVTKYVTKKNMYLHIYDCLHDSEVLLSFLLFLGQCICLGYPSGNSKVQFTLRCKIQAYTSFCCILL